MKRRAFLKILASAPAALVLPKATHAVDVYEEREPPFPRAPLACFSDHFCVWCDDPLIWMPKPDALRSQISEISSMRGYCRRCRIYYGDAWFASNSLDRFERWQEGQKAELSGPALRALRARLTYG